MPRFLRDYVAMEIPQRGSRVLAGKATQMTSCETCGDSPARLWANYGPHPLNVYVCRKHFNFAAKRFAQGKAVTLGSRTFGPFTLTPATRVS